MQRRGVHQRIGAVAGSSQQIVVEHHGNRLHGGRVGRVDIVYLQHYAYAGGDGGAAASAAGRMQGREICLLLAEDLCGIEARGQAIAMPGNRDERGSS